MKSNKIGQTLLRVMPTGAIHGPKATEFFMQSYGRQNLQTVWGHP